MRNCFILLFFIALLAACTSKPAPEAGRLTIAVPVAPYAGMARRIAGDAVDVKVVVGTNQSPHSFDPAPADIAGLSRASVYFTLGLPFEAGLLSKLRGMNPGLKVVDLRQNVRMRHLTKEETGADAADHAGEAEGESDPHIWMAPKFMEIEARTIAAALAMIDPSHRALYETNLAGLVADLNRLDAAILATLLPFKGRRFYVFHPAFGYFADAYGLIQVPVEAGGREPGASQMASLVDRATKDRIGVIYTQPQFPRHVAETVARELGARLSDLDTLSPDYMTNLARTAERLKEGFQTTRGQP